MCIEVQGGHALHGEICIQGSKNAALPIIAGALMHDGITVLHNCPRILDVMYMVQILREMGCRAEFEGSSLRIDASGTDSYTVPFGCASMMRCSIVLLGSLLGRFKRAVLPYPGGCTIGARPIDLHLDALRKMNASIEEEGEVLNAWTARLTGTKVNLAFPSVGATENAVLAAVLARGETEIINAAREPEIQQLCEFLTAKGARITGIGTGHLKIRGVESLTDSEYELMPDRIVTGTYLLAAAATRGSIVIEKAPVDQLDSFLDILKEAGGRYRLEEPPGKGSHPTLIFEGKDACLPVREVETAVYPGFPTDLQSPLMAVLAKAEGESVIRENVFENRFQSAELLNAMGARISTAGRTARITGVKELYGKTVSAPDLRGGAALVIAGLCARGSTVISNEHFIGRGYEDITGDLRKLGAKIWRTD